MYTRILSLLLILIICSIVQAQDPENIISIRCFSYTSYDFSSIMKENVL